MLLNIKLLGSETVTSSVKTLNIEARPEDSVESLKAKLQQALKLDQNQEQKLLFMGKTLQDGTQLSSYKLANGSKIHLMLKQNSSVREKPTPKLEELLLQRLKPHFRTEEEAIKVVTAFLKIIRTKIDSLNLDDIERLSKQLKDTNTIAF